MFIVIDDPLDPRIEAYRDIRERDLVGRAGMFVAEGKVVVEKLIDSVLHRPVSLLIAEKRIDALVPLTAGLSADVPVYVAHQAVIDAIAGFPLHRGILAIGRRHEIPDANELLLARQGPASVLLLSGIANHDNIGGIFRNAAAFGIDAVLIDADCCDPLYRKAIRVSVGATLLIPYARLVRGEDPIMLLQRHGLTPVALSPQGADLLGDWLPEPRTAVLLGAEGPGLPPDIMQKVRSIRIAMSGGFDSLNVATTSGIVLHHLVTAQHRGREATRSHRRADYRDGASDIA